MLFLAASVFAAPIHAQNTAPQFHRFTVPSRPAVGNYYATGETIRVRAAFDEPLAVDTSNGTPTLNLLIGQATRVAAYAGQSNSHEKLFFDYTVDGADHDDDGFAIAAGAVALNGGTIVGETSGLNAVLTHGALAPQAGHRVNKDPEIESTGIEEDSSPTGGQNTYGAGETIRFTVTFDTRVVVDATNGSPRMLFTLGHSGNVRDEYLVYQSGSGTTSLSFVYVVQSTDEDNDGIRIGSDALELNGGAISHATTGRDADITHNGVDSSFLIDGSPTATLSLTALSLSGISLCPEFSSETTSYRASVADDVEQTTVIATPEAGASATVAPEDADSVVAGHQVALARGENEIRVTVEQAGESPETYTIIVKRVVQIGSGTESIEYDLSTGYSDLVRSCGEPVIDDFYSLVELDTPGGGTSELMSIDYASSAVETAGDETRIIHTDSRYPTMTQVFVTDSDKNIKTYVTVEDANSTLSTNRMVPIVLREGASASIGASAHNRLVLMPSFQPNGTTWNFTQDRGADHRSYNVTALYDNDTRDGLVVGAITHENWRTGIDLRLDQTSGQLSELKVISGVPAERDTLDHGSLSGNTIQSSTILMGFYDDFRYGLEDYAHENHLRQPKLVSAPELAAVDNTTFSWKTWGKGSRRGNLTYDNVIDVLDFAQGLSTRGFANRGGQPVMALAGKFRSLFTRDQWASFAEEVQKRNQMPGWYFLPWQMPGSAMLNDPIYEGATYTYRDIAVKDPQGNLVEIRRPTKIKYALDPTHPGTLARIDHNMDWFIERGFKWLRLDFMYFGTIEGVYHDSSITTGVQAYNHGMKYLTDKADGKIHLNLAISPYFPYQWAQSRRISGDVYYSIEDVEYELNALAGGWWMGNGVLYEYLDPGSVDFHPDTEYPELSRTQVNAAAITGMMQSDDDWNSSHIQNMVEKYFLNPNLLALVGKGRSFMPVDLESGNGAPDAFVHYEDGPDGGTTYYAIFNYDGSNAATKEIETDRIIIQEDWNDPQYAYTFYDLWDGTAFVRAPGSTWQLQLPAEGSKIYKITRAAANDTTAPTVAITGLSWRNAVDPITVTFTFDETVTGFAEADIVAAGGAISSLTETVAGREWTATFTPEATAGTISVSVSANAVTDAASNAGPTTASTVTDEAPNATGRPTIAGTAMQGETLTASPGDIQDADGLTSPGYSYQWVRMETDGTGAVDILGATSSTYVLTAADLDKRVQVRVSFTDDGGNEEARTSSAYPAMGSIGVNTSASNATLSALALVDGAGNAIALHPMFVTGTTQYTASVANGVSSLTVTATTGDSGAMVEFLDANDMTITDDDTGTGALDTSLNVGANTVKVKVTSADGNNIETYTVVVTRAPTPAPLTVTITSAATFPTKDAFTVTIEFSATVSGFASGDVAVTNGSASNFNGSGTTYTVTVTPDADFEGDVAVAVSAAGASSSETFAVDTKAPQTSNLTVNGEIVRLAFDELLDGAYVPDSTAFPASVNGAAVALALANPVLVRGQEVTLNLAASVLSGAEVTVSYAMPNSGALQDALGNEVASFSDLNARNNTPGLEVYIEPHGEEVPVLEEGTDTNFWVTLTDHNDSFESDQTFTLETSGTAQESDFALGSRSLVLKARGYDVSTTLEVLDDALVEEQETIQIIARQQQTEIGSASAVIAASDGNANLKSLALSGGVKFRFDPDTLVYHSTAPDRLGETTVVAEPEDSVATVEISPEDVSEEQGHQVRLNRQSTNVTATVTAGDGNTEKNYRVTVRRETKDKWFDIYPFDLWGDGEVVWVLPDTNGTSQHHPDEPQVMAFTMNKRESRIARLEDRDIKPLDWAGSINARGLWSNGETLWISARSTGTVFAHRLSDGAREPDRDIELHEANSNPYGIWGDGETLWVVDPGYPGTAPESGSSQIVYAYNLADGSRIESREFSLATNSGFETGIWSDGETWWVGNTDDDVVYAYESGLRVPEKDIDTAFDRNFSPSGIWSDGENLWVIDRNNRRMMMYPVDSISSDARLTLLRIPDVDIGTFAPSVLRYVATVPYAQSRVNLKVFPAAGASLAIDPADASANDVGHQIDLAVGDTSVNVVVTAADGTTTKTYTVVVTRSASE